MGINEDIFYLILESLSGWTQDATIFLQLILLVDYSVKLQMGLMDAVMLPITEDAKALAEEMLKHLAINISPYKSFDDLYENCPRYFNTEDDFQELRKIASVKQEYHETLESLNISENDETIRVDLAKQAMFNHLLEMLKPKVRFFSAR